jgi:hypothetical protein
MMDSSSWDDTKQNYWFDLFDAYAEVVAALAAQPPDREAAAALIFGGEASSPPPPHYIQEVALVER